MIGDVLGLIAKEVARYIDEKLQLPVGGKKSVILQKPANLKGEFSQPDNTISLSLINIEEETGIRDPMVPKQVINGKVYKQNPPVNINLQIIFIANFPNDYTSELNAITKVIEFFQQKPFFNQENMPDLKKYGIGKLSFKLNTVELSEQHNIWNLVGTKYMPSLLYKISMITIQDSMAPAGEGVVQKVDIKSDIKKP